MIRARDRLSGWTELARDHQEVIARAHRHCSSGYLALLHHDSGEHCLRRPGATDDEIVAAARRAQADEFISQLPNGYSSLVGERGGHLSVGQRQRIGIARAFLKTRQFFSCDEPTSALDPSTEAAIMATIKDLMSGRTTLIVTHRLGTIHNVDQIIVMEHGRIVEQGTGPQLVERGGVLREALPGRKLSAMSNVNARKARGRRLVGRADSA